MDSSATISQAQIPAAQGLPVVGHLFHMIRDPIQCLLEQHRQLGDIFQLKAGTRRYIVLAGIDANLLLGGPLRDNFSSRETWGRFVEKTDCPHLLIGTDGEPHAYQRKLLKPFFAKENFRHRFHHLSDIAEQRYLEVKDKTFHVGPFVRHLFCQQIGMVLQNKLLTKHQTEALMHTQNTVLNVYMLGKWPRAALLSPRFLYTQALTRAFSWQLIQAHDAEHTGVQTYMDKIAQGQRERPEWFTPGDLHAHTIMPFTGGVDPAGGAMSFVLYELVNRPELAARLRKEVDRYCQHGFPDYDTLDEMHDIEGFILEVLRVHPTGFALSRTASQDIPFAGHVIPGGSELLIFNTATHFNPDYFARPDVFDIERYRPPRLEHKTRGVFAPFGRGPHTCVGNALAELQLKVNTIALLRHYDLELATPASRLKTVYIPGPFMSPNFKLRLRGRQTG